MKATIGYFWTGTACLRVASPGGESLERRRQMRFAMRARVNFAWTDRDGVMHKGEGFSRDMSSHGVYVCAEWVAQPQRGLDIDIDVLLPAFSAANRALHVSGRAKVIRVEPTATNDHSGGFVAESHSYVLQEEQE